VKENRTGGDSVEKKPPFCGGKKFAWKRRFLQRKGNRLEEEKRAGLVKGAPEGERHLMRGGGRYKGRLVHEQGKRNFKSGEATRTGPQKRM